MSGRFQQWGKSDILFDRFPVKLPVLRLRSETLEEVSRVKQACCSRSSIMSFLGVEDVNENYEVQVVSE